MSRPELMASAVTAIFARAPKRYAGHQLAQFETPRRRGQRGDDRPSLVDDRQIGSRRL
jgi:hypothetical protein